jgi:5-formyltetrahydrofolate cyclo-ligase
MDAAKSELRTRLHARLRESSAADREAWSVAIRQHLTESARWKNARTVMIFAALRFEPDLVPLLESADDKSLAFPGLENDRIVPRIVRTAGDLVRAPHGIREPDPRRCPMADPFSLDLVLVPGLAFSPDGHRLGRGRGHYDRFLATLPPSALRCGICFSSQLVPSLPVEPHDATVSRILTESGWAPARSHHGLP